MGIRIGSQQEIVLTKNIYIFRGICPNCDNGIRSDMLFEYNLNNGEKVIVGYECPICACIIYKEWEKVHENGFKLKKFYPNRNKTTKFSDEIKKVSTDFITIYNESEVAENNDLLNVCGPGYRKSLEFLIKDYIIKKDSSKQSEVENKFLGRCINENIEDARIKEISERAAWLGNDETHYVEKWNNKDLQDMKGFITQVIFWIESELQYEKMKEEMPKGK